jgi:hypothetical protein
MNARSYLNRIKELPDVFYRYVFKNGKIYKTQIKKKTKVECEQRKK